MYMTEKGILLVEDNENDILLTIRALEKAKIKNQLTVVRDGVEALDFLMGTENQAECDLDEMPQVILLDLNLPRVNGLEVLRKIRANQRTRLLPVVVLTSSKEEADLTMSYLLGANSYIRKPVSFTQFTEAIYQLGSYWLGINETPPKDIRSEFA